MNWNPCRKLRFSSADVTADDAPAPATDAAVAASAADSASLMTVTPNRPFFTLAPAKPALRSELGAEAVGGSGNNVEWLTVTGRDAAESVGFSGCVEAREETDDEPVGIIVEAVDTDEEDEGVEAWLPRSEEDKRKKLKTQFNFWIYPFFPFSFFKFAWRINNFFTFWNPIDEFIHFFKNFFF